MIISCHKIAARKVNICTKEMFNKVKEYTIRLQRYPKVHNTKIDLRCEWRPCRGYHPSGCPYGSPYNITYRHMVAWCWVCFQTLQLIFLKVKITVQVIKNHKTVIGSIK